MKTKQEERFLGVLEKRFNVFSSKNADYGSSFEVDGLVGIVVRLGDKLMRLKQTYDDNHMVRVKDEGLRELFLDIGNYCDLGLMVLGDKNEEDTDIHYKQEQL